MDHSASRILQWNAQGVTTVKEDIIRLIETFEPSVLGFQETYLANNYQIKQTGYTAMVKQGTYNRGYYDRVAMYIHDSCPFQEMEIQSSYQITAIKAVLGSNSLVTIANFYIPGSIEINLRLLENTIETLPRPCVIFGNFDTYNQLWESNATTPRGRNLEQIFANNNLNILNTGCSTHVSDSVLDLTIASPGITANTIWEVYPSVLTSDHHPNIIAYETPISKPQLQQSSYTFKKADWMAYSEDDRWKRLPGQAVELCEDLMERWYEKLHEVADNHVPKFQLRRYYPKSWWNPECSRVWKE